MSQVLEEIKQIILSSDIDPQEQNDLLVFLPILPENTINDLCKIFQKDPDKLKEFNNNFKSKIRALIATKEDEIDEAIRQEAEISGDLPTEEEEIEEEKIPGLDELAEEENF